MRDISYCTDEELGYARWRAHLDDGQPLRFDDSYRMAHLPLVAPDHPAVIDQAAPREYRRGRSAAPRYSLVLPVDAAALERSANFLALDAELRSRSFADKIAWDMVTRRTDKLHVTLAGSLAEQSLGAHAEAARAFLARHGALRVRLAGPFCGTKNRGRIYFAAYPQRLAGDDAFGMLQDRLGVARTGLYLLGYYNLRAELTSAECAELGAFLARWARVELIEYTPGALLLIATHDDLALESRVVARLAAVPRGASM